MNKKLHSEAVDQLFEAILCSIVVIPKALRRL